MTKLKIGADEIILWLRKNGICKTKTTKVLGLQIKELIESLGGEILIHDVVCYWNSDLNLNFIDEFELPKTATQYKIDINQLSNLYSKISNWS